MPTSARKFSQPYAVSCRPNVRKWSIDAVPMWVIVCGWIVVVVGCAVIGVTW